MPARRVGVAVTGLLLGLACLGVPAALGDPGDPGDPARSTPRADPVYPAVGDDVVDALHYDLRLDWRRPTRELAGLERLTFRAARASDGLRLDLSRRLRVAWVRLDGVAVPFSRPGDDLVVTAPVVADSTHELTLSYRGRPAPVRAPGTRDDVPALGLTPTPEGGAWTMQEPYGALTWYAVDDQPSDKARYDVTVTTPPGWRGVSGGRLVSERVHHARRTMHWRLSDPASSYLTTLAIGDYERRSVRGSGTVPIVSLWVPAAQARSYQRRFLHLGDDLGWLERRLGPYPWPSLGVVLVPSRSAMETQSTLTLGAGIRPTARWVVVHEVSHQWYGDLVTPSTWRDVWMNEGMATYLQTLWESQHGQGRMADSVEYWHFQEAQLREDAGPPADYEPTRFGDSNVYYVPALMWHRLRQQVGDAAFWDAVRAWPQARARGVSDEADLVAWWSARTGQDLAPFFQRWLHSTQAVDQAPD